MVNCEDRGDVYVITIDRPEAKNAIDKETADQLREAWNSFGTSDAKVGILTGQGTESFSAGADLKKMDLEDRDEGYLGFTRMTVEKPTLAAIEGYCVAGGLEMALWCDMRIASREAEFGCYERRFGVPLVDGGTQRLPRIIGQGRALDMIITGRSVDAETAMDWGLVNRLTPAGDALETAIELGETIADYPQSTLRADRKSVYRGIGSSLQEGLDIERELGNQTFETALEGAREFSEGAGRHGEGVEDV
ncbi:MAG: crotonase/enoyl-CoA hydratase family protein [bacterium]